jgi:hypothetical protein
MNSQIVYSFINNFSTEKTISSPSGSMPGSSLTLLDDVNSARSAGKCMLNSNSNSQWPDLELDLLESSLSFVSFVSSRDKHGASHNGSNVSSW